MRILITGNMGYVGPVLTRYVRRTLKNVELIGFDAAYFGHSLTGAGLLPEALLDRQVFGEFESFPLNCSTGSTQWCIFPPSRTIQWETNLRPSQGKSIETPACASRHWAAERGVTNFVFASSCSIYGYAERGARKESDPTIPLTAYARSKIGSENAFAELDLDGMVVTSLRFATACGMSDRLRLDLVLNDFVACAVASSEITVLSDGTPWRPLIDVEDMARSILWATVRQRENGGKILSVNAGRNEGNYQVRDLAEAVARQVPAPRSLLTRERYRTIAPIGWTFPCSTRSRRTIFQKCRPNS